MELPFPMTFFLIYSNLSSLLHFGVGAGILIYLALPSTCLERCLGCLLLWCYSPASLKWWILYILRGTTAYTVNKTFCFRFGGVYLSVLPALLLLPKKVGLKLGCVGPLTHS